jgi:hypothetical protein
MIKQRRKFLRDKQNEEVQMRRRKAQLLKEGRSQKGGGKKGKGRNNYSMAPNGKL